MENNKRIIEEQYFTYEGMDYEEMQFYLNNVIKNCKEICNTVNTVNGKNVCDVVEMSFKKNDNKIIFNGSLSIESENRCVDGIIHMEEDSILVDMHITRLCVECQYKEYNVRDEFKRFHDYIARKSIYSYDTKNIYETLEDEKMRGKIL